MINFTPEEISKILKTVTAKGGDFADIYITRSNTGTILAEENKIQRFYRGYDMGAGIRLLNGDFASYFYTNDCTYNGLLSLGKKVSESMGNGIFPHDIKMGEVTDYTCESDALELETIGKLIKRVNQYASHLSPLIKQVSLGYGGNEKNMLLGNSEGHFVMSDTQRKRFFVKIVAEKNGEIQTAISTLGDTLTNFSWKEDLLNAKVDEAANRAIQLLEAKDAPSGPMTVILSSSAGGTMVHEACGHGLEADHIEKGLSVYKDKLGQYVASEKITVIDDATLHGNYGSYTVDDEGELGRKNILIRNGVLEKYMCDIRTAKKMGVESTGNGRREGYSHSPQVRMSNTYIAKGNDVPAEILRDTKKGLFVKKMGGGQVNTNNGDFVFEVSEGYLIENGELTYPVKNATLIGNGPKTLSSVFAVGNDLGFAIGTCGKGGQSVAVGDAQPTLGLSEVIVGGTQ